MRRLRNWLLFMFVVLLWSLNWIFMKSGIRIVGPLNFLMQNLLFASLALSPFLIYRKGRIPRDRNTWLNLLLFSLISVTGVIGTYIGLAYEESGISAVLTYTQPLFVFCLAVPFLKEERKVERFLGIVVGFFGVAALYFGRHLSLVKISYAFLFLLYGAFVWAVTIVYYKKFLIHVNPVVTNLVRYALGGIILSILSLAFEGFSFNMTGTYIFVLLYTSICATAVAFSLWIFLLQEEEATVVSASSLIIPMVALILGWLFLQETLELKPLLGFILILIGVYLVNK